MQARPWSSEVIRSGQICMASLTQVMASCCRSAGISGWAIAEQGTEAAMAARQRHRRRGIGDHPGRSRRSGPLSRQWTIECEAALNRSVRFGRVEAKPWWDGKLAPARRHREALTRLASRSGSSAGSDKASDGAGGSPWWGRGLRATSARAIGFYLLGCRSVALSPPEMQSGLEGPDDDWPSRSPGMQHTRMDAMRPGPACRPPGIGDRPHPRQDGRS